MYIFTCSQSGNLLNHKRFHTCEKPYKCNAGQYSAADKANLIHHKQMKHCSETQSRPVKRKSSIVLENPSKRQRLHHSHHEENIHRNNF